MKAKKNDVEMKGMRNANVSKAVLAVSFIGNVFNLGRMHCLIGIL